MKRLVALGAMLAVVAGGRAGAEDASWPRFRGPNGAGVAATQRVPVELTKETLGWSATLPGSGTSSPVVWGGRLFVTGEDRERGEVILVCMDARSGREEWRQVLKTGKYATHQMNNAAAATPCVSGDLVAVTWYDASRKKLVLSAFAHDGKARWEYEVGPYVGDHGPNLNPEIHEGRIILAHLDQTGGYVVALDGKTGQAVWKADYPGNNPKTTYITPLVRERHTADGPRKEVVVACTHIGVRGLDFATGTELWAVGDEFKERCITSPVDALAGSGAKDSLIVVSCKNNVFFAVRPPDVTGGKAEVVWRLGKNAPYVPTPVSDGRTLYVLADGGVLQALNALDGSLRWQDKLPGNFYASPLLIGGKLYCQSREGEMFVAEVDGEFKLVATSDLNPGPEVTWADATPAVAHDSLYVRLGTRLDYYRAK